MNDLHKICFMSSAAGVMKCSFCKKNTTNIIKLTKNNNKFCNVCYPCLYRILGIELEPKPVADSNPKLEAIIKIL